MTASGGPKANPKSRNSGSSSRRLGMTTHKTYIRVLAALFASELCISFHPPENQRAQGRPGARRTRGPVCKNCAKSAHGNNHRQGGITPAFPAQWFTAYFGLSPVNQLVCHRRRPRCVSIAAGLTPAWARQDHTTSPSAKDAVRRSAHPRPPRARLACRDDRDTPLRNRGGMRRQYGKSEFLESRKFS